MNMIYLAFGALALATMAVLRHRARRRTPPPPPVDPFTDDEVARLIHNHIDGNY